MARALTWICEKIKMVALQLALANVILPDETDEFLPTKPAGCRARLLQTADLKAWENLLRNLGVTARASRLRSWIDSTDRNQRPRRLARSSPGSGTPLGGVPSVNRTWRQFINHPKRSDSLVENRIPHQCQRTELGIDGLASTNLRFS